MCQFCHQHGEGQKWYLNAANYSDDLLSDARRQRFLKRFFEHGALEERPAGLERFARAWRPLQRLVAPLAVRRMKRDHFGQVLPLEDVEQVFGLVNSIVRVACVCRHLTMGRAVGCCYGIALDPRGGGLADLVAGLDHSFLAGPDVAAFDRLSKQEALAAFTAHEHEGLCHTIWTFGTPFIGGICNCDRRDCLAMRATLGHDLKVMFRAEYVAAVDPDACHGCRACMQACQFGAIGYSVADRKAYIDPAACYGCGICRQACSSSAIALTPRQAVPAAAGLW